MVLDSKDQDQYNRKYYTNEPLTEKSCINLFGLGKNYTYNDLRDRYIELTKIYHPDKSENQINTKYYLQITNAFNYLKNLLHERSLFSKSIDADSNENQKNPLKEIVNNHFLKQPKSTSQRALVSKNTIVPGLNSSNLTNFLKYTITLDRLEIFEQWAQTNIFKKEVRYTYQTNCSCEELCCTCRGCGTVDSIRCLNCNGHGWAHYCQECKGQGIIFKKDSVVIEIEKEEVIPLQLIFNCKGDQILKQRTPLLIFLKLKDNVIKINDNKFLVVAKITPDDLKKDYLDILLGQQVKVPICVNHIKAIPYYTDLSKLYNLYYTNKKIQIILKLVLVLK